MSKPTTYFTCYEHQSLKIGDDCEGLVFSEHHYQALSRFHHPDLPYYNLIHNGVKFKSYVGVLQVGNLTIEVLPKADKSSSSGDNKWRQHLIDMLRVVGAFKVKAPTQASLSLKGGFILDIYFELFLKEVAYLMQRGLLKQYRKTEGNQTALKGSLHFSQHLRHNLVRQERFYTRHTTYDTQHLIHQLLRQTLHLIRQLNQRPALSSKVGALLLNFPEMPLLNRVTEATFERLPQSRQTEAYQPALDIARLLLLNYHPDVSRGQNHVLALMFDMNLLWERFIAITLRQDPKKTFDVKAQLSQKFWESEALNKTSWLRPDILLTQGQATYVLDTKWKNLTSSNPSASDLQQLYAYLNYFNAQKVALIYPGRENETRVGEFIKETDQAVVNQTNECSVITFATKGNVSEWQDKIREVMRGWIFPKEITDEETNEKEITNRR